MLFNITSNFLEILKLEIEDFSKLSIKKGGNEKNNDKNKNQKNDELFIHDTKTMAHLYFCP